MTSQYTIADITTLLHRLVDSDPTVRAHAAGWLGVLGDSRATFSLSCCLRDEVDDDVRIAMIRSLAKISDPLALDVLIELHSYHQQIISEETANAIRSISVSGLKYAQKLLDSPEATERILAARILEQFNAVGIPIAEYDHSLISIFSSHALYDDEQFVRISLTAMLGIFRDQQAIPPLLQLLYHDNDTKLLASAARALGYFPQAEATEALSWALNHPAGLLQEAAIWALAQQATPAAIDILVQELQNVSLSLRSVIITALGDVVDPHAIRTLILATGDHETTIRALAAQALGRLRSASNSQIYDELLSEALPTLFFLLQDEDEQTRATTAEALAKFNDHSIILPLIALLSDNSAIVRAAAANSLHCIGDNRPIFPLRSALRDQDILVRRAAISALSSYPCHRCIEPCALTVLQNEDQVIRQLALLSLSNCTHPHFIDILHTSLSDSEPLTTLAIIQLLYNSNLATDQLYIYLKQLLKSTDSSIRRQSLQLFISITADISSEFILPLIHDQNVDVRLLVVQALSRFANSEIANSLLKQRLIEEYDDLVRAVIITSLTQLFDNGEKEQDLLLAQKHKTIETPTKLP